MIRRAPIVPDLRQSGKTIVVFISVEPLAVDRGEVYRRQPLSIVVVDGMGRRRSVSELARIPRSGTGLALQCPDPSPVAFFDLMQRRILRRVIVEPFRSF